MLFYMQISIDRYFRFFSDKIVYRYAEFCYKIPVYVYYLEEKACLCTYCLYIYVCVYLVL